jgi:hypothetical protein
MVALIFEAEADEHPPPPVPASVALPGSILSTDATALSMREGILERDRIARFTADDSMSCRSYMWFSMRLMLSLRTDRKYGATEPSMTSCWRGSLMFVATVVQHKNTSPWKSYTRSHNSSSVEVSIRYRRISHRKATRAARSVCHSIWPCGRLCLAPRLDDFGPVQ